MSQVDASTGTTRAPVRRRSWLRSRAARTAAAAAILLGLPGLAATASADQVVVDDPVISGDPAFVPHHTGMGWENDHYSTVAEGEGFAQVNGAQWSTSGLAGGTYNVEVWVPGAHGNNIVKYFISHSGGEKEVRLHQEKFANVWVRLGTVTIDGPNATVRSTDAGGFRNVELAWDAVRWTRVDTPPAAPDPTAAEQIDDEPDTTGPAEYITTFIGPGWDGDTLRTYAEGDDKNTPQNTAEWVTTLTAGKWEVAVWIPNEHSGTLAEYTVRHAGGETVVTVDQTKFNDSWVVLGTFDIDGPQASVWSPDTSGVFGEEIAWDAVRWRKVPPPEPEPESPTVDQREPEQGTQQPTTTTPPAGDRDDDNLPDDRDACPDIGDAFLDLTGDGCPEGTVNARSLLFDRDDRRDRRRQVLSSVVHDWRIKADPKSKVKARCEPKCRTRVSQPKRGIFHVDINEKRFYPGGKVELRVLKTGSVGQYISYTLTRSRWQRKQCLIRFPTDLPERCP